MDGFAYSNIFDTKGIEYLAIITFLALLVPFWIILNKQVKIKKQTGIFPGILSAGSLRIPPGLFYSSNHTWTYLEKSGSALLGLDDLLLHITGEVKLNNLKNPDEYINKGDLIAEMEHKGKLLRISSPISGRILKINSRLNDQPDLLLEDPYDRGWIYKIKPANWIAETSNCFLGDEASAWSTKELFRFKDFLAVTMKKNAPETSMVILQDGGEICDKPLSELPNEIWQDFQKEFLNPAP